MSPCDLAWPGLVPLGVLWAELAPQAQADVLVKFLWAELRAFSWLILLAGWWGPVCWLGANISWNVFVKGASRPGLRLPAFHLSEGNRRRLASHMTATVAQQVPVGHSRAGGPRARSTK